MFVEKSLVLEEKYFENYEEKTTWNDFFDVRLRDFT
jgi:hypothetical protein